MGKCIICDFIEIKTGAQRYCSACQPLVSELRSKLGSKISSLITYYARQAAKDIVSKKIDIVNSKLKELED